MGRTALIALGGYAFAWCVGFVVVFAPAGAGIREVLLVAALGPVIGTGPATAVALVSRAVNTISDLLCAGRRGGRPLPRRYRRPGSRKSTPEKHVSAMPAAEAVTPVSSLSRHRPDRLSSARYCPDSGSG